MRSLERTYDGQGRPDEAEKLGLEVVDLSKKTLVEDHSDTLLSKNNLAALYYGKGRAGVALTRSTLPVRAVTNELRRQRRAYKA